MSGTGSIIGIGSWEDEVSRRKSLWYVNAYHNGQTVKAIKDQLTGGQRTSLQSFLNRDSIGRKPVISDLITKLSGSGAASKVRFIELSEDEIYELEGSKQMRNKRVYHDDL